MHPQNVKLTKQIAGALLDLFPLAGLGKIVAKISLDHVLGIAERNAARKSIDSLASEVVAKLESFPNEHQDNQGSAQSAAFDIAGILKKSGLGPERLVSLNLDPLLIEQHLLITAGEYLSSASAERAGFVSNGLKAVAGSIANAAPELPGVTVAFMQAMLKSRDARTDG